MRLVKIRSCVAVWALVLGFVAFTCGELLAETEEDERWSVDFGAISISEAFDELTRITGIRIFTTTPLTHNISPKRYVDQSIDQILKDMLKNVNYAAVWLYGKRGLESIGISPFDRDRGEGPVTSSGVEGTGTANRSLQTNTGSRQLRPGRPVSGPARAARRLLLKPEQGSSPGLTHEEDSETEEKDEEPVSPPTEVNDTSSPAPSDSQVESTTDSSNEEEGPSTDQQDKGEESAS